MTSQFGVQRSLVTIANGYRFIAFIALLVLSACESAGTPGDWPAYGADKASTKYSPLDQINAENVAELEVAWRWTSIDQPLLDADTTLWTGPNESTPLAVGGILYTSTSLSQVAAIDGATGETIWTYNPESYRDGTPPNVGFVHRGVAYWEQGDQKRIVYGTATPISSRSTRKPENPWLISETAVGSISPRGCAGRWIASTTA